MSHQSRFAVILFVVLPKRGFIDWLFETWAWLRTANGGDSLRRRAIVTPTHEDFPVDLELEGEELAEDYFLFVREHAGLQEWPLHIVADSNAAELDEGFPIPYDLGLVREPAKLVSWFARGSAHYVIQAAPMAPPVEEDEYLVDATTIFLGFGLFASNALSSFDRHGPFIVRDARPLMAEHEIAFALAVYGILAEVPDRIIEEHLGASSRVYYRKAVKHVLRHHHAGVNRLLGREPALYGPYR